MPSDVIFPMAMFLFGADALKIPPNEEEEEEFPDPFENRSKGEMYRMMSDTVKAFFQDYERLRLESFRAVLRGHKESLSSKGVKKLNEALECKFPCYQC
jgi:hypothetical protein